ncbi:MAG: M23 family metallopeptidase [Acetobacteraceae bacterium]|nr:M23 family metallopeptidase [Acetobacteraceae bacterium]
MALAGAALLPRAEANAADTARANPAAPTPRLTPLIGEVLSAPRLFPGSDGHDHLVYEVRLSNVTAGKANLKRLAVLDLGSGKPLAVLDEAALGGRFSLGGRRGAETTTLGEAQFGVAFLHVRLEPGSPAPSGLAHEVEGSFEQPKADLSMRVAETPVVARPPPVLGPPLRGGGYVAGDGCCDSVRHVRALLPLDGAFRLSQRFAIDWERIDAENRVVRGDLKEPRSYRIYGEPVLAVADGTVAGARNDLPDQTPGALPDALPVDEVDGNFVVLDIGGGAYVNYAHLRPGSVRVRAGDRVRRGDHIGDVGNTGNSQAPHLHLHVMDGPSPLAADGVPYVFEAFTITASDQAGTADFDRAEATGSPLTLTPHSPPLRLRRALPLDLTIVDWGGPAAP